MILPLLCALIGIVSAQKPRCGVPKNINTLPDFAQEELRELWKSFRGGSCEKEILIQQDILKVISTFDTDFPEKSSTANNSGGKSKKPTLVGPSDYDDGVDTSELLEASPRSRSITTNNEDYLEETTVDDVAMMRFNTESAPFLRSASPEVKRQFVRIWKDDNIPSEGLRTLKIQTLAVSLLNAKQLDEYNSWATKRRKVLKAREQELRGLSRDAKRVLRRMSTIKARDEPVAVSPHVRRELSHFVEALNRRRSKKLLLLRA